MEAQVPFQFSPAVLRLLQSEPAAEIEAALRKAFPQYFQSNVKPEKSEAEKVLDWIFSQPPIVPKGDVTEQIRQMRDQDHLEVS